MGRIRIGCSGWSYRSWREVLYPPKLPAKDWLPRYAEVFDTVEVNSTFYRLARPGAAEAWIERTPPEFLFTLKASRYLTHIKRLIDIEEGVAKFYAALEPLPASTKCGPTLWQLPPNFKKDLPRLGGALELLPEGRHLFEFRHPTWFEDDEALDLLRAAGVGLAIGDHPDRPWQPWVVTAEVSMVRLHYGKRGRRGNYSQTELAEIAPRLEQLADQGAEVLTYLNNDWEGFAVRNGMTLQKLLGQR